MKHFHNATVPRLLLAFQTDKSSNFHGVNTILDKQYNAYKEKGEWRSQMKDSSRYASPVGR